MRLRPHPPSVEREQRRARAIDRSLAPGHHGGARTALLLIDVINPFEFPGAGTLYRHALPAAVRIRRLKEQALRNDVPTIYVNDNFGRWQSDFHETIRYCQTRRRHDNEVVNLLAPSARDYFVLKPMHSGFYLTPLEMLLEALNVHTVVLTGFATDMCVLYTAADAHMRHFGLIIPRDCVAAQDPRLNRATLDAMRRSLAADVRPSAYFDLRRLARR